MIHSLYILNKAGGLVYHQDYSGALASLSINDYLVFAGTIHGVHAIALKLTPSQLQNHGNWLGLTGSTLVGRTPIGTPKLGGPEPNTESSQSGLEAMISQFLNPLNSTVANSALLNSLLVSYTKLSTNYFYMNSNATGLNVVETTHFNIFIFQTLTGLKFIAIASPHIQQKPGEEISGENSLNSDLQIAETFLRRVYVIYSDYVMKNPFYSIDMPIKADLFDQKLKELVEEF